MHARRSHRITERCNRRLSGPQPRLYSAKAELPNIFSCQPVVERSKRKPSESPYSSRSPGSSPD